MLVVVPYLVQHPGSRLGDVATLFGMAPEQLRRDLDLLFMSGLPPYGPGDLIDVDVDEDDRIWITMADHFARPLRLTRSEALALYVRGTELVATPGLPEAPDLASALGKLRETLGPETLDADGLIEVMGGGIAPEHLALLREAAETHHRVDIEYFSASSEAWSTRTIEPEAVFSSLGNWYVVAWDLGAEAERLFRADRVRTAIGTLETFEPHGLAGAGRDLYTPGADDVPVRLRLRAGGAVDRRVLRHDRRRRARRRLARGDAARTAVWGGSRRCSCASGLTPRSSRRTPCGTSSAPWPTGRGSGTGSDRPGSGIPS